MLREWVFLGAVALGCANSAYRCDPTHACNAGSSCTAAGYCAEPVAASLCPSGLRYSSTAAAPGTCVPASDGGADVPPTPDVAREDAAPDLVVADAEDDRATVDPPPDAAPPDAALDAPPDIRADVPPPEDAAPDAAPDALPDAPPMDAPRDVTPPMDAPRDVTPPMDAPRDVTPPMDAPRDLTPPMDASPDVAPEVGRDVGLDLGPGPDAGRPCSLRPLSPLAGTRISNSTLRVLAEPAGDVREALLEYSDTVGGPFRSVPLSDRGDGILTASVVSGSTRLFWRLAAQCGAGRFMMGSTWWTWHRLVSDRQQGILGWVPDVTGDALVDPVIAAPMPSPTAFVRAYTTSSRTPEEIVPPIVDRTRIGRVVVVPDMNGDGAAEVAVGSCARDPASDLCARQVDVYSRARGAWSLYHRATMPVLGTTSNLRMNARFGASLAGVGDLDADGYGDLLIGAPPNADEDAGAFYVLYGGPTPSLLGPFFVTVAVMGGAPLTRFAWSAAGVGDLDLDNRVDFVVTSFQRAWVFHGMAGRGNFRREELAITAVNSPSGFAVTGAGDLDQDHRADFALARDGTMSGVLTAVLGRASTFAGLADGTPNSPNVRGSSATYGLAVLGGIDLAGDNRDDLILSAPGTSELHAVWILGSNLVTQRYTAPLVPNARLGLSLGAQGDHDGDGTDEFAASAFDPMGAFGTVHIFGGDRTSVAQPFRFHNTIRDLNPSFGMEIGR